MDRRVHPCNCGILIVNLCHCWIDLSDIVMKITIEVDHKSELEKLKALFRSLKINMVSVVHENESQSTLSITKGNKHIDPHSLFGIWSNEPKSLEQIRKDAWQRKRSM